jgi:predicted tellurium resistance membrane protein TerC
MPCLIAFGASEMTIFGQYIGILLGFVLIIKAGGHLDRMTARTDHLIRVGYYLLTVAGGALVIAPFAEEWWMLELGWLMFGTGAAIFLLYGRREQEALKKDHG